jgi:hypothetical protein
MKKIIFIALFLLLMASVSAIMVKIYPSEMKSGLNDVKVVVMNHGETIKKAHISLAIPDLNIRQEVQMKLKTDKSVKTHIAMDVPENAEGYYPLRVTISDKSGVQKKTHTWVFVE